MDGWTTQFQGIPETPKSTPIKCICDSVGKTMTIAIAEKSSLDPKDYPNQLKSTSDLLSLIGTYANAKGIVAGGDIGWAVNNYSLMKLTVAMLDHKLNLGNIVVNVDDPEEWDYKNGEFDEEIRIFEEKNSAGT